MNPLCEVCAESPSTSRTYLAKRWLNVCCDCGDDQGVRHRDVSGVAALFADPQRSWWHSKESRRRVDRVCRIALMFVLWGVLVGACYLGVR